MTDNRRSRIRRHPMLASTPPVDVAAGGATAHRGMLMHEGQIRSESVHSSIFAPESCRTKNQQTRPRPLVVVDRRRPRQPRQLLVAILVAVAVKVVVLPRSTNAQYTPDTPLFEETMAKAEEDLTASLKGGEYVEDVFFPDRQVRVLVKPYILACLTAV